MTDQPKAFDAEGLQFAWDSTSLKIAEECLYKYKLKMIDGWTPRNSSVHLKFGGWYASALESYHKYIAEGMDENEALIEVVGEALIETWEYELDEEGNPIPGTGAPWASDHNTKTRENLIRTIIWYVDQFGEDDSLHTIKLANGKPAVELSFRMEVDDGLMLCGHFDRFVEYGKKPYITDNKTTGSTISSRYWDQWSPDTQMSLYTYAGKAIFDIPIKGIIIDAAQIAVGFSRFERGFTFRDDAQLQEWYESSMYRIAEVRRATRENYFPMNPGSCDKFGGCQFRHVCSKSPVVREQFLKGDFERGERWDPLKVR
jgi:hypothetical protein